jgi:hypothetical protein
MKSQIQLILLISFLFTFSMVQAQQKLTGKIFTGEWFYKLNHDTIILEKEAGSKTDYQKWIFKESGQMNFTSFSSGKYTLGSNANGTWLFDEVNRQLKINREKTRTFAIIRYDKGSLKLKELK